MQNSQPYPGFPHKAQHHRAGIAPRCARRGALMPAALLAVLVITIMLSQFAGAQLRQASAARSEARAVQLAVIAADFDYYVHADPDGLVSRLMESTRGRTLTASEQSIFEQYLRVGVAWQIPGFTLTYLVGHITDGGAAKGDGSEVFGGLLLGASATNGASQAEMDTLVARLATYGGQADGAQADAAQDGAPQDGVLNLDSFVQNVLGRDLTGSERVILTAPLSGLDSKYVLREARAGHPAPKLAGGGALDLGGNNLLNVGTLTVTRVVTRPDPQKAVDTPPSAGLQADSLTTLHLNTKRLQTEGCTGC